MKNTEIIVLLSVALVAGAGLYYMVSTPVTRESIETQHEDYVKQVKSVEDVEMQDTEDRVGDLSKQVAHLQKQFQQSNNDRDPPPTAQDLKRIDQRLQEQLAVMKRKQDRLMQNELQKIREQYQYELNVKEWESEQRLKNIRDELESKQISKEVFQQASDAINADIAKIRAQNKARVDKIPNNIASEFRDRDVHWLQEIEKAKGNFQGLQAQIHQMKGELQKQVEFKKMTAPPQKVDAGTQGFAVNDFMQTGDFQPKQNFSGDVGLNQKPQPVNVQNSLMVVNHDAGERKQPVVNKGPPAGKQNSEIKMLTAPPARDNKPKSGLKIPKLNVEVRQDNVDLNAFNKKPFAPSFGGDNNFTSMKDSTKPNALEAQIAAEQVQTPLKSQLSAAALQKLPEDKKYQMDSFMKQSTIPQMPQSPQVQVRAAHVEYQMDSMNQENSAPGRGKKRGKASRTEKGRMVDAGYYEADDMMTVKSYDSKNKRTKAVQGGRITWVSTLNKRYATEMTQRIADFDAALAEIKSLNEKYKLSFDPKSNKPMDVAMNKITDAIIYIKTFDPSTFNAFDDSYFSTNTLQFTVRVADQNLFYKVATGQLDDYENFVTDPEGTSHKLTASDITTSKEYQVWRYGFTRYTTKMNQLMLLPKMIKYLPDYTDMEALRKAHEEHNYGKYVTNT